MEKLLLVFLGGGLGSAARYGVSAAFSRAGLTGWPYNTFTVNVLGGLLMGLLFVWLEQQGGAGSKWRMLFGVGVLGGFTTFSAFSLETALMIEKRQFAAAGAYVALSVAVSIAALLAGLLLARKAFA